MYLSRLILNPRTRRVQRELANPYELHRTLMAAFPPNLPQGERVLYRVDVDARSGVPVVLLQSHSQPDWAWLGDPRASGYLQQAPEAKTFCLTFVAAQTLTFRLRANPTVKRWLPRDRDNLDREKKPMRLPITSDENLRSWLDRKGTSGGFRVVTAIVHQEGTLVVRQRRRPATPERDQERSARSRKLTFHAVLFEGILQVTDPEALWSTVQQGIGSAKGFGFGLLSLAPAQ